MKHCRLELGGWKEEGAHRTVKSARKGRGGTEGLMGVTDRSRSAKEACGSSLTWGRQTSSLGNMSESRAGL